MHKYLKKKDKFKNKIYFLNNTNLQIIKKI